MSKTSHKKIILRNLQRIKLWDIPLQKDYVKEERFRILYRRRIKHITCYLLGFGKRGIEPYFDILVELAYDPLCRGVGNLNCVIINKGDNNIEVFVDDKKVAETELITQDKIYFSDVSALVRGKWVSFNFHTIMEG